MQLNTSRQLQLLLCVLEILNFLLLLIKLNC